MCGICGTVGPEPGVVEEMLDRIAHRGPDDRGSTSFTLPDGRTTTLGHRRLSILDPTPAGHQPMADASGRIHLTYNGELYNYPELRADLERRGLRLRSTCDTEVLVNLLALDGLGVLPRLNGIFAFAAWDAEADQLWLVRDRAGTKPLYYTRLADGGIAFASEFKALVPLLATRAVDPHALSDFFTYLWTPGSRTAMAGIEKLEPAELAVWHAGGLTRRSYWELEMREEEGRSDASWIDELRDTFDEVVQSQQLSDVPLGAFLSGGVDSSAVVAAMRAGQEPIKTFAIGYSNDDRAHDVVGDDLQYARQMAGHLGVDHEERVLSSSLAAELPRAVWHMDEPVADPAALSTLLICEAASEDLTVIMSGVGGDELFAGYPRHRAARMAGALRPARPIARAAHARLEIGGPGRTRALRRNLKKFLGGAGLGPEERYLAYFSYFAREDVARLLPGLDLAGHDSLDFARERFARTAGQPYVNRMLDVDWHGFLHALNLTYTDKMGMAASVEVRVPFLDNRLVDLAARMPADLKMRGLKQKWALKESQRGLLPNEVIDRKKAGFGAPIRAWLAGPLAPSVDRLAGDSALRRCGFVDLDVAASVIADYRAHRTDNALQIWALLTLDLWLETFVERDGQAPVVADGPLAAIT